MKVIVTTGNCLIDQSGQLGTSCIEADPIVEPLAITTDVLQLRGEWVLQNIGNDWRDREVSGPDPGFNFETGQLVEVSGADFGNFIGKIIGISYNDSIDGASSTIKLATRIIKK